MLHSTVIMTDKSKKRMQRQLALLNDTEWISNNTFTLYTTAIMTDKGIQ